jgi:hypothetical protein
MPFKKPSVALNLPRLNYGTQRYTDTMEFLSPGVLISYKKRVAPVVALGAPAPPPPPAYPTANVKLSIQNAAVQARNIVRIANDILAGVVMLRKPETALFTAVMARHFNLSATGGLGGFLTDNQINKPLSLGALFKKDRRWYIDEVRQKMLSLSFHLNTGMYLIDIENAQRTVDMGSPVAAGTANPATTEAYVVQPNNKLPCIIKNGEMHIEFSIFPNYSLNSRARIIVHEAAHKYLGCPANPDIYAHNSTHPYPPTVQDCLSNADSIAWAAVSLATGHNRMTVHNSNNWDQCPGGAL